MFRTLLSCLLLLAFATEASAQTTPLTPPAPAPMRHTTQQKTTTHRTTSKPRHTIVRKTSTQKVGMAAPATRPGAEDSRQRAATATPGSASGKGQGMYAAPGEPVDIQNGATTGYDGAAPRRPKTTTTLTPR